MCSLLKILDGISVLLVDDHADFRFLACRALLDAGARVDEVESGAEGFSQALVGSYDVLLLDARLPDFDGNTLVKELRLAGYTRPVVALTASATTSEVEAGLAAGHDGYLTKPIPFPALVSAVATFATRKRRLLLPSA